MNCPIVFKKATLEDEGEYLRLSKLFYATDAVLSPLPEEFHKNIFKEICRSSAYLEAFLFSFAGEIAGYGLVSKRFSTEAGGWNAGWKTCSFCRNSGEKESAEHFWTL